MPADAEECRNQVKSSLGLKGVTFSPKRVELFVVLSAMNSSFIFRGESQRKKKKKRRERSYSA
jgi:hypothetical protein